MEENETPASSVQMRSVHASSLNMSQRTKAGIKKRLSNKALSYATMPFGNRPPKDEINRETNKEEELTQKKTDATALKVYYFPEENQNSTRTQKSIIAKSKLNVIIVTGSTNSGKTGKITPNKNKNKEKN